MVQVCSKIEPSMFFDNLVVLEIPDMPTLKTNARVNISIGTRVVDNLKSSLDIWLITIYTSLKGVVGNTKTIHR